MKTNRISFYLWMIISILAIFHIVSRNFSPVFSNAFSFDREANIPTWFSTVMLFSISISSLLIYRLKQHTSNNWNKFWIFFAAFYCFLSLDEAACLHEILDSEQIIKWIFVYAPLCGIFYLVCIYYFFIQNSNRQLRNWILIGLFIYALGGLIGETIDHFIELSSIGEFIEILFEELFELIGTSFVLIGVINELNTTNIINMQSQNPLV